MALAAFTSSLIKNIPDENIPKEIDLVLDGGAFNGIYMMGSLNYLKQLEKNNKISIIRVSGCSIGGILGVCYLLDKLDNILALCKDCFKYLRKHQVLKKNVELFKNYFNETITDESIPPLKNAPSGTSEIICNLIDCSSVFSIILSPSSLLVTRFSLADKIVFDSAKRSIDWSLILFLLKEK